MDTHFPDDIQQFLESSEWTFAKTYAENWPHHYLVKNRVDPKLFLKMVKHIRQFGKPAPFYRNTYLYYQVDKMVYWTMVPPPSDPAWYPPEEETIINKCPVESTYEYRLKHGTLPDRIIRP